MIAFDTNILIYSVSSEDPSDRHSKSFDLIAAAAPVGGVVPLQVIGEFLNVCRQKKIVAPQYALKRADEFLGGFECPETRPTDLLAAFGLAERMLLQYFDALIVGIARRAGARILLSEDMHDGLEIDGLRIVNPFVGANETLLADYLGSFS
ncbi:MAG: PIN domain-containing protein [Sphingomonadaceae bacterium]|nr:PIN domain-containing protein [Sphingomonadaceae bacterium]